MKALSRRFEIIDEQMVEILRQKTEVERLEIAARLWQSAREIMQGAILTDHPDWDAERVDRELAHRMSHGVVPR